MLSMFITSKSQIINLTYGKRRYEFMDISNGDTGRQAEASSGKTIRLSGRRYLSICRRAPVGDTVEIDSAGTERLRDNFLLETMIGKYADNLQSLRGLRFDWARNDGNQDHVYSNQAFTHKLNEFRMRQRSTTACGEPEIGAWMVPLRYWRGWFFELRVTQHPRCSGDAKSLGAFHRALTKRPFLPSCNRQCLVGV
jgi:hypothetical protein